ncbi:MAG: class I SAM-dependent methyltransferase [Candidatus Heimdallarchaeota archaeon]|nr:class I SAM-dependent methyltransferase [Candidatus Heimdallarchaeota archaeon]MDH5644501.1 class I SAM-dependent methyltransferase [Candidatus Heimdallarchaeota archaeon]
MANILKFSNQIIKQLGLDDNDLSQRNIEHFTETEGPRRDKIVLEYFGEEGFQTLIEELILALDTGDKQVNSIIDLGTGTGTFLLPISQHINVKHIYGLDLTPALLEISMQKFNKLNLSTETSYIPIIGDMEKVKQSIQINTTLNQEMSFPHKFDLIMSSLALHHIPSTSNVLKSISEIIKSDGKAVIVDAILSDNSGMIPQPEHAHDGFDMIELKQLAEEYFKTVQIKELSVKCHETKTDLRGSGLFLLILSDPLIRS